MYKVYKPFSSEAPHGDLNTKRDRALFSYFSPTYFSDSRIESGNRALGSRQGQFQFQKRCQKEYPTTSTKPAGHFVGSCADPKNRLVGCTHRVCWLKNAQTEELSFSVLCVVTNYF